MSQDRATLIFALGLCLLLGMVLPHLNPTPASVDWSNNDAKPVCYYNTANKSTQCY